MSVVCHSFYHEVGTRLMIAVDYFRQIPGSRPPLACFLSHVHSDHLAGLETLKSPLYVIRQDAERHVLI